ncbi:MAG: hypothetical protein H6627_05635 [Calditrichae bacterium]|nr:hypothetical protein [Calditrichia bacterium]
MKPDNEIYAMIIQDIHLSGFINLDPETGLDLSLIENKKILSARAENKRFLFFGLIGVIYGLSKDEKRKYKDKRQNVLTGRIDIRFDDYIMHIERDFETDIVAILSSGKNTYKPVFQDKDIVGSDSRPYLKILESFFSITDKQLIMEICNDSFRNDQSTLGELLDLLYLLIRPKFKMSAIKKLISSSKKVIEFTSRTENNSSISANLQDAINQLHLLKNAKKLAQSSASLDSDITKLQNCVDSFPTTNPQDDALARLKQRFPLIYQLDATMVKRDITRLHALQTSFHRIKQRLNEVNTKKTDIENIINKKLLIYSNLPDSFEDDFIKYQELTMDQAQLKNDFDRLEIRDDNLQTDLSSKKKTEFLLQSLSVSILLLFGLILFSDKWPLITGLTIAVSFIIYFSMRFLKKSIINDLEESQQKRTDLKTKLKNIEKSIYALREESYLLDDQDYIDSHIERFRKYKSVKKQLDLLNNELNDFKTQLDSDKFKFDMPHLERKYKDLINLNPPEGLQTYIDEFETIQKEAETMQIEHAVDERLLPLVNIIYEYSNINTELKKTRTYIEDFLEIEEIEKNIDRRISELERQITHLKQQIQLENA